MTKALAVAAFDLEPVASPSGRDVMLGLMKTCRKLGIRRSSQHQCRNQKIPPLADLIAAFV
jgi:hypothetical protein